jgi:uncharacterized 2Fe-2S/4Fe-4S cluster protein (DUF4445 family)
MKAPSETFILTIQPSGMRGAFPQGTVLADALLDMGMPVPTPCGGRGTCGKCGVRVEGALGKVLACRTTISGDMKVHAEQPDLHRPVPLPAVGPGNHFSVAVDIGTTTVRISLKDLSQDISFEIASFLNPQRRFGHDVISRIAAGSGTSGFQSLQDLIRRSVNARLGFALKAMGIEGERIERIVFSGNTTMLYLLFGLEVEPLGRHPYTAEVKDFPDLPATDIGLEAAGQARACSLPVLGAFTGADLVGALALCREAGITRNAFFIDLGTNGELFVLDRNGQPYATSCAMGPALEGMNISWGMTADDGAIIRIFEEKESLGYEMIGEGTPAGITGTALVDLLALLLDRGIISERGNFTIGGGQTLIPPLRCHENQGRKELSLWGDIRLTQQDIRSLQLAKGASLSAAWFLLEASGCTETDIEHVIVAGAFGEHLDLGHFHRLGFIPVFPRAGQKFMGNTSLKAAEKACLDPDFIRRAAALRDTTREIVLSIRPDFHEVFIRSLDFPGLRKGS